MECTAIPCKRARCTAHRQEANGEGPMPIYEYICPDCGLTFDHFWPSIKAAEGAAPPVCPACGGGQAQRIISQVAVLGELGGLTPSEQAAENAQAERLAKITPKEQIEKLRAGKKRQEGQR
uniref:Zinc ribbon domain-containing protein n=1 Tax=Caldilinea aerophila TaxID=133453 RepID=A0A7C1FRW1_9CHLR